MRPSDSWFLDAPVDDLLSAVDIPKDSLLMTVDITVAGARAAAAGLARLRLLLSRIRQHIGFGNVATRKCLPLAYAGSGKKGAGLGVGRDSPRL